MVDWGDPFNLKFLKFCSLRPETSVR